MAVAVIAPVILLILMGGVLAWQIGKMADASDDVTRTHAQLAKFYELRTTIAEQESSLRAYLLAGDRVQLAIAGGVGASQTAELIIVPGALEGQCEAVLELGYIERADSKLDPLLAAVSQPIALAIRAAEQRVQLQSLLEETQRLGEELQAQHEELRVTNEELEQQGSALRDARRGSRPSSTSSRPRTRTSRNRPRSSSSSSRSCSARKAGCAITRASSRSRASTSPIFSRACRTSCARRSTAR
jgi:hypothetical protein